MGLMAPGIGNLGKMVIGTSQKATIGGNGGSGIIGKIEIPESGIWVITCSGWRPGTLTQGIVNLLRPDGGNLCGTSLSEFWYSLCGILQADAAGTVSLRVTNWSSGTQNNIQSANLIFQAVKVGEL